MTMVPKRIKCAISWSYFDEEVDYVIAFNIDQSAANAIHWNLNGRALLLKSSQIHGI